MSYTANAGDRISDVDRASKIVGETLKPYGNVNGHVNRFLDPTRKYAKDDVTFQMHPQLKTL